MPSPGSVPISMRNGEPWRGMTTQSKSLPGHFELLENCYVSSDGSEIRPIPGFRTYIDLTTARVQTTGGGGFEKDTIDARRPVTAASGGYFFTTTHSAELKVWSDLAGLHGFEQVAGRWILFGESGFRREPILNSGSTAYIYVTDYAYDGAGKTILTFNQNYLAGANTFNAIDTAAVPNSREHYRLYLSGLTGNATALGLLNNQAHVVDAFPAANQVRITTNLLSAANDAAGQTGYADWVTRDYSSSVNSPSDDHESLTIWTIPPSSVDATPIQSVQQAYVANRQRDFGDATTTIKEGGNAGCSRRRQLSVPYRLVPADAGDRLIMAAPGYNCVFQAPVTIPLNYEGITTTDGIQWVTNDIYDKPRCVGVPKAVMYEDTVKTSAGSSVNLYSAGGASLAFGGSGNTTRTGRYKFAVSYKDSVTGEEGLLSEPITITTDDTNVNCGVRLLVLFPGYVMHESLALSVNIYRSQKNGEGLFFDRTIPMDAFSTVAASPLGTVSAKYGVQVGTGADDYRHLVEIRVPYTADETLVKHQGALPLVQQMPMGCKAVHTMRGGWTVYGGALGNSGHGLELWKSTLSMWFNAGSGYPNADEVFGRVGVNTSATTGLSPLGQWGTGVHAIPPAYAGQIVFSRDLFPYPRESVQLNKVVNNVAASSAGAVPQAQARDLRFQIDKTPLFEDQTLSRSEQTSYLRLPRAQLQISEADHPDVVPASNTTIVSHETGEDVEAIGEANGQMVVCTRGKTYVIGYGLSPVGVPPELASSRFGCVGANTMESFDYGCAWVSDRGPCAVMGGGFQWIGETIQHFFSGDGSRYLRDSTGMMRHAWTAHDPGRALLFFGLYADRDPDFELTYRGSARTWTSSNFQDEAKSRWPCDEVLVFSYRINSWSVWRPPTGLLILWMAYGVDQQTGQPSMFFLGSDNRVYKMDDDFAQWNEQAIVCTVQSDSTGTTITTDGTFGTDITARGNGTFVTAGMEVLVISQAEGRPLVKRTTLVSVLGSDLTLADSVDVTVGDEVHVGVRSFQIDTNYLSAKMYETARTGRVSVRYSIDGPDGSVAYAQAVARTTQVRDSENEPVESILTKQDEPYDDYSLLGESDGTGTVMDRGLDQGALQGTNARVSLRVVGSATLRLQDLYAEVQ